MVRRKAKADEICIHVEDADTVALFFALDTQWRRHAMTGDRLGLDYAAIQPTAALYAFEMTPRRMAQLRRMEIAATTEWAKKR